MALSNASFDGILAALIPSWGSNHFASLFVRQNAAWEIFLEKGRIQSGGFGTVIVEPTSFPTTTGPQIDRIGQNVLQDRTTSLMTGSTAANFKAAMYGLDYSLSKYEMSQFGADTQKADWAEWNTQQAIERQLVFVEADWWAPPETANSGGVSDKFVGSLQTYINSGTTTATDGGALPPALSAQSLAPFVVATGTTAVTSIGGIERAAAGAAYWACGIISPGSSAAFTIQELDRAYELAVVGKEEPDLIIIHRDIMTVLQNLSTFGGTNGGQVVTDPNSVRLGHRKLYYRNAEIVTDDRSPTAGFLSGTATARNYNILCLNTKWLSWRMREKKPKFRRVDDAREIMRYVSAWMLQFTMKGAGRYHSRHINITAPVVIFATLFAKAVLGMFGHGT